MDESAMDEPGRDQPAKGQSAMDQPARNPITNFKDLPLIELFSIDEPLNKKLIAQIDAILRQRLKNEMMISHYLHEGAESGDLSVQQAAELHNRSKDSISDLVKIKQLLGGLPTESKTVTHTIDTAALLEALRLVRSQRVTRRVIYGQDGRGQVRGQVRGQFVEGELYADRGEQ